VDDYPPNLPKPLHTAPVPRRIRATLAGATVLDTTAALYVWEAPYYPQYYIPREDVVEEFLLDEEHPHHLHLGTAQRFGLRVGEQLRPAAARLYTESPVEGVAGRFRFEWGALDHWYEEDEEVFVHPRSPYVRVDALRSTRTVRVELEGAVLAESSSPVLVFETGLPTRYYLNRTEVDFNHLESSATETACPYKGRTTVYWSVRLGDRLHEDLAWSYDFPTRQLLPIAGLVAFYNEKVDTFLDGVALERPQTHFS
jgi:uncharacterized protein (DUF427 family)